MKMKQNISFETTRTIVKFLLIFAGLLCLIALLFGRESAQFQSVTAVTAAVCIVLALLLVFIGLKCPYCGKTIVRKCLVVNTCPHCGRNLISGLKGKKKKK